MKCLLIILSSLYTFNSYAFDWRKCIDYLAAPGSFMGAAIWVSTSQFSSSWGECEALSKAEEKKIFYFVNHEHLKIDIVKGHGEYLKTFLDFENCSMEAESFLKINYINYFTKNDEASYESLQKDMKSYCHSKS